jgi:hypothetical protein
VIAIMIYEPSQFQHELSFLCKAQHNLPKVYQECAKHIYLLSQHL